MLVLAFIGHGEHAENDPDRDFFFQPYNASVSPTSDTSFHLVQFIKDLHRTTVGPGVDGLLVLVDTCSSGVGAAAAAAKWISLSPQALRFEFLTAAADRPAADGCFTRQLVAIIREGLESPFEPIIRCEAARRLLIDRCPNQSPQLPSFNADPGLFLARNRRYHDGIGADSAAVVWSESGRLTLSLQPTKYLSESIRLLQNEPCVALIGNAGTGKSTIAAALLRPERSEGCVPSNFVQAVAFISESTSPEDLATQLSTQLRSRSPSFAESRRRLQHSSMAGQYEMVDRLEWDVVLPLRTRKGTAPIRIVIDGLDQLPDIADAQVRTFIEALTSDPEIQNVHTLLTSRPDSWLPSNCRVIELGQMDAAELTSYLHRRGIENVTADVVHRAGGNWLVASLQADMSLAGQEQAPTDATTLFSELLRRAGIRSARHWNATLKPVLAPLAISGAGATLPLSVLCAASHVLGGPSRKPEVRDVLVSLPGLVVRSLAGTESETVGLFHTAFAEFLLSDFNLGYHVERQNATRALLDAILQTAPVLQHSPTDPLHQYAATAEPALKWSTGDFRGAVATLKARPSLSPVDNLHRWGAWFPRIAEVFSPDDEITLRARGEIAFWTGKSGDILTALGLQEALLADQERVLGTKHLDSLLTRASIAHFTGKAGRILEAVAGCRRVLKDLSGRIERDDPELLRVRAEAAYWIAESGDMPGAQILYSELVEDYARVFGPESDRTLDMQAALASAFGENGDPKEARDRFAALAKESGRLYGEDSFQSLLFSRNRAHWTAKCGAINVALRELRTLSPRMRIVLGPFHREALLTRGSIARWTSNADKCAALQMYTELLRNQEDHLGPSHSDTLTTRQRIAELQGEMSVPQQPLAALRILLTDSEKGLGPYHPRTIGVRASIAHWTGKKGKPERAITAYMGILADQERFMGLEHPQCLRTRANIGRWYTVTDACQAVKFFESLVSDQKKTIGPLHPTIFETRAMKADALARCGNIGKALRQLEGIRDELVAHFGGDHPGVSRTEKRLDYWRQPRARRKTRRRRRQ